MDDYYCYYYFVLNVCVSIFPKLLIHSFTNVHLSVYPFNVLSGQCLGLRGGKEMVAVVLLLSHSLLSMPQGKTLLISQYCNNTQTS